MPNRRCNFDLAFPVFGENVEKQNNLVQTSKGANFMTSKRKIRKMKKEFERLIKTVGTDNLALPEVIEKSLELEREMYEYCGECVREVRYKVI